MTKSRHKSIKLLALLSSASVSLAPAAFVGAAAVLLAPATALAANECATVGVDPSANGATADSYTCTGTNTYLNTGITYVADGNLTMSGTSTLNVGTVGINLFGDGSETITWTQTTGNITGTDNQVMLVQSGTGAINLSLVGLTGTAIAVEHGMLVTSTSGAINVTTTGTVNVNSNTAGAQQIAAIRTTTSGVTTITTSGSVTGRLYGIHAESTGAGAININANGAVSVNSGATPIAAIYANGVTGAVTVSVGTGSGTVDGTTGAAILTDTTGTQTITIASGRTVSSTASGIATVTLGGATGTRNITNAGTLSGGSSTGMVLRADGATLTLTNSGTLTGLLDLDDISGNSTVTNSGTWSTAGDSTFSAGTATLNNSGTLTVSGDSSLTGLDTLNNSGTIALGTNTLTVANAAFNASGASLLTVSVSGSDSGQLALPGSTVSGVTNVRVSGLTDTSAFNADPIVLVDVTGGTTADGDFILDPASTNFVDDPMLGDSIATTGLFAYTLRFNPDTDQHLLISAPRSAAYEYVPALQEAITAWHTTANLVAGRQADLHAGRNRGMWVRVIGDRTERDYTPSFTNGGNTFDFDAGHTNYTGAVIAGFDVLAGTATNGDYVMGFHGGLVRTRLEMNNSDTTDDMDGVVLGIYGGVTNGPITFDGTINTNLLSLDHNDPILGDTSSNVLSIGARAELGYVWPLSEAFYVQPIVTAAYMGSSIKEIFPQAYEIQYDDVQSARAALGLRIGSPSGGVMGPVGFWLAGRAWREFADEANVRISTEGAPDFVIVDDLSGDFQELEGGLTLATTDSFTAFVSAGAKFHDEYDNYSGSVGVRWRW